MTRPATRTLLATATALSGLVAGTTIDTAIVKLPSWRRLGAGPWAAYTRAELPTSLVWYPVLGIGGVLANLATVFAVHRDGGGMRSAVLPSRALALLAIGHLLTTAKAAPYMVRVKETDDQDLLREALEGFTRWNGARAVVDTLAFAANLWLLASVEKS